MAATMATKVFGRTFNKCGSRVLCQRPTLPTTIRTQQKFFTVRSSLAEKKYTEDHEWVELDSNSKGTVVPYGTVPMSNTYLHCFPREIGLSYGPVIATIGISTYAAKALGDVVYVELPTTDLEIQKGDTIGAVESVKSASDIMSPVSGTVVEVNGVLEDSPSTINKSPEGEGWLAKIEVTDVQELKDLMDEAAYKKFTEDADDK